MSLYTDLQNVGAHRKPMYSLKLNLRKIAFLEVGQKIGFHIFKKLWVMLLWISTGD